MAVTAFWYVQAFKNAFDQAQALDWDTDVIKILLTTSAYTPNQDTGDKPLIIWIDFGQDESSSAGDFAINMNASGIGTVTPDNAAGFP